MYTNSQKFYGLFHKILRFSSMKFVFTFSSVCANRYLVRIGTEIWVFILINEIIFYRNWIFCPNDGLK